MAEDPGTREVTYSGLNWIGKAVYLTGQAARLAETVIETVVDRAATLIVDAERAFTEGLDGGIEDAKVLEEYEEPRRQSGKPS